MPVHPQESTKARSQKSVKPSPVGASTNTASARSLHACSIPTKSPSPTESEADGRANLRLHIGKRSPIPVGSLAEASERYSAVREALGFGASRLPEGRVCDDADKLVARVSYNGRVWPPAPWVPDMTPLYDNRVPA
jgi:hypothetical protein